jgi:GTP-binding protein
MTGDPLVAIVGRPNVGKSTLFNRLIGAPVAVVHGVPGTTRDRLYGTVSWGGRDFTLVDTGGMGLEGAGELEHAVLAQVDVALEEADVILFLTDGREGPVATDFAVADTLRRTRKPIILVTNKVDSRRDQLRIPEFYELGLGEPAGVSALRGLEIGDLLDRTVAAFPAEGAEGAASEADEVASIAIVGRPNVGKSSLLNALLGRPRAIVAEAPGTTRDALDTEMVYEGRTLRLIDTAGIRRRGHIARGVETYSVLRAMRAIDRAEIGAVLIDAHDGVTAQDAHIAGYIHEAAKGCVIAVNKWDLVTPSPEAGDAYMAEVRRSLNFLDYAPVVFLSARTGLHVSRLLDRCLEVAQERDRRVPTAQVNEFVHTVVASHPHTHKGKALKCFYATQSSVRPPTFVFFVNDSDLVHFTYRRYLENQLRERFGFAGTGIRLVFRNRRE